MSLVDILENELKLLLNESKKKYPQIKDKLQEAITSLENFKKENNNSSSGKNKQYLINFPTHDLLKPLQNIPETKNNILIEIGMQVLQKLLNLQFMNKENITIVLNYLDDIKENQQNSIQLKLIQSLLMCINPNVVDFQEYEVIEKILLICLTLHPQKNILIQNTSLQGCQYLMDMLFDKFIKTMNGGQKMNTQSVIEEEKEFDKKNLNIQPSSNSYQIVIQNASQLIHELLDIQYANNPIKWFPKSENNDQSQNLICYDLLMSIFKQAGYYLLEIPEINKMLSETLYPNIKEDLEEVLVLPECNFKKGVRAFRGVQRMTYYLRMGYMIFDIVYKHVNENKKLTIYSYMITETVQSILSNYNIIIELLEPKYQAQNLLAKLIDIILIITQELTQITADDIKKQVQGNVKNKLIDSNWADFPDQPKIILNQLFKQLIECTLSYAESLELLYQSISDQKDLGKKLDLTNLNEQQQSQIQNLASILELTQKSNLKINKYLLQLDIDEASNQNILKVLQKWITLSGSLQMNKILDSYLKILARNSIGETENIKELSPKNIQTIKIYFNIAHCLGNILDPSSWHIIFQTMQKLNAFFQSKLQKQDDSPQHSEDKIINSDIQILDSILQQTFTNSHLYSDQLLVNMIDALNQLTLSVLEELTLDSPKSQSVQQQALGVKKFTQMKENFGLQKMLEMIQQNHYRIDKYWDLLQAHFICIANCKLASIRNFSIAILSEIIAGCFQYFIKLYSGKQNEQDEQSKEYSDHFNQSEKWNCAIWQLTLFQPFLEIIKSKYSDIKESLLNNILKLIQDNGHQINTQGFNSILKVLLIASEIQIGPFLTGTGFRCLEVILSQHIFCVDIQQFNTLITLIDNFRKAINSSNTTYQSVQMFWNVGDNLAKRLQILIKKLTTQEKEQSPVQQSSQQSLEKSGELEQSTQLNQNQQSFSESPEKLDRKNSGSNSLHNSQTKEENLNPVAQNLFLENGKQLAIFEDIWSILFEKLKELCFDQQFEVKQSAIHAFSQLIITNSQFFRVQFWISTMQNQILTLIDTLFKYISITNDELEKVLPQLVDSNLIQPTPKFNQIPDSPTFKFSPNQQSRIWKTELIKQWQEILRLIVQNIQKIIKKSLRKHEEIITLEQDRQQMNQIIIDLLIRCQNITQIDNCELFLDAVKLCSELFSMKTELIISNIEITKNLIDGFENQLADVPKDNRDAKVLVNKVLSELIQCFFCIYKYKTDSKLQENLEQISGYYLDLCFKIFEFSRQADALNICVPFKIWEEKPVYDHLNELTQMIVNNGPVIIQQYIQFLVKLVVYPINGVFNDLINKKVIEQLYKVSQCEQIDKKLSQTLQKNIVGYLKQFINCIGEKNYNQMHKKQMKNMQPIWLVAQKLYFEISKSKSQFQEEAQEVIEIVKIVLDKSNENLNELKTTNNQKQEKMYQESEQLCLDFIISQIQNRSSNFTDEQILFLIEILEKSYEEIEINGEDNNNNGNIKLSTEKKSSNTSDENSNSPVSNEQNKQQEEEEAKMKLKILNQQKNIYIMREKQLSSLFQLCQSQTKSHQEEQSPVIRRTLSKLFKKYQQIIDQYFIYCKEEENNSDVELKELKNQEILQILKQIEQLQITQEQFNHLTFENIDATKGSIEKTENQVENKEISEKAEQISEQQLKPQIKNQPYKGKRYQLIYFMPQIHKLVISNSREIRLALYQLLQIIQQEINQIIEQQ